MKKIQSPLLKNLLNIALFQLGWWGTVLSVSSGYPLGGPLIVLVVLLGHFLLICQKFKPEILLVLSATLLGIILDSTLSFMGFVTFPHQLSPKILSPYYFWFMWSNFAILPNHSLNYFAGRYGLAAFLGALGGPLSYYAGAQFGVLSFPKPIWYSLLAIGVEWLFATPLLFWIAKRLNKINNLIPPKKAA